MASVSPPPEGSPPLITSSPPPSISLISSLFIPEFSPLPV